MNTKRILRLGVSGLVAAMLCGAAGCGPEPTARLYERAVEHLKAGEAGEGIAGLEEVLAREPEGSFAAESWNWLGLAHWAVSDFNASGGEGGVEAELDRAEEAFGRAAQLAPGDWRPVYNLAHLQLERGRTERVKELLREADKLNPAGVEVPLLLGDFLTRRGQWEPAKNAYHQARKRDPQCVEALTGLGRLFVLSGDYAQAETSFLAALEMRRKDGPALYNLGVLHSLQGHAEEAAEYFRRYLEVAAEGERAGAARKALEGEIPRQTGFGTGRPAARAVPAPAAETAASIWKRAVEQRSAAEAARALEAALANHDALGGEIAKRAAAAFPQSLEVQLAAGEFWESAGDFRDALDAFRRAQALDQENAEALSSLARVAVAAKEFDTAVMALNRLRALEPGNADALWQLAGIYADDLGMTGRAVGAYCEFERLFASDARADGVRERVAALQAAAAAPKEQP